MTPALNDHPKHQSTENTEPANVTSSARRRSIPTTGLRAVLLGPSLFFTLVLFLAALGVLLTYSFHSTRFGQDDLTGTAKTWNEFFHSSYRWSVVVETLKVSILATVAAIAVAIPTAYALHRIRSRVWKATGLFIVFAPLMTSVVARVYGWSLILGESGPLGTVLGPLGLGDVDLMYSTNAVVIALVHVFLPFAVFPIMSSLTQFDWALNDAANDLGASRFRSFARITVPAIAPGIIGGAQIVFALSMSSFVTPAILGGGRVSVLATEVYDDVNNVQWPMAAVSSFVLLVLAIIALGMFNVAQRSLRRGEVSEDVATPLSKPTRTGARVWLAIVYCFLIAPLLIIIVSSFSSAADGRWPPPGFSLEWYSRLLDQDGLGSAFLLSVLIGCCSAAISVAIGTTASIAFHRYRSRVMSALSTESLAPMVVPKVTMGLAAFLLFHQLGFLQDVVGIILMHVVITLPFVVIVISSALSRVDSNLESAAQSLGASRFAAFRASTFYAIRPALLAASLFVFIISFDELDMTIFMLQPGQQTLPVWMFIYMQKYQDPTLAALASVMILLSLVIAAIAGFAMTLSERNTGRWKVTR